MEVGVPDLDAEGVVDRNAFTEPLSYLHVFCPGIGSTFEPKPTIRTTDQRQILNSNIRHMNAGLRVARQLRGMAGAVSDCQRRSEGDRAAGYGGYLLDLIRGTISSREPRHR